MPFQPVPNSMKVEIRFLREGQQIENVLIVNSPQPIVTSDLSTVAGAVQLQVGSNWMPQIPANTAFIEVQVTDISVEGGQTFTLVTTPPQNGAMAGASLPNETSLAVRLKAPTGGRHGSGRLYWVGLTNAMMEGPNTVASANVDAIIDAISQLIDALETLGYLVVILSRFLNNVQRPEGVVNSVQAVSVFDRTVDSQRRRKPGIGT